MVHVRAVDVDQPLHAVHQTFLSGVDQVIAPFGDDPVIQALSHDIQGQQRSAGVKQPRLAATQSANGDEP